MSGPDIIIEQSWRSDISLYWRVTLPPNQDARQRLAYALQMGEGYNDDEDHQNELAEACLSNNGDPLLNQIGVRFKECGVAYSDDDAPSNFEVQEVIPDSLIPNAAWRNVMRVLYGQDPLDMLHDSLHAFVTPEYEDGAGI